MSVEREQMKIKLANLRHREKTLAMEVNSLCTLVRHNLNTHLTPVRDLAVSETASQMDELVGRWGKLQATISEIGRLEKELD